MVKDNSTNIAKNVIIPLLKFLIVIVKPDMPHVELKVQKAIEHLSGHVTGVSMHSIAYKQAKEILENSQREENDIRKLAFFMEGNISQEIDSGEFGNMLTDEKIAKQLESLTHYASQQSSPDEQNCESLSSSLVKVGQALLKYYNNFIVLHDMDNFDESMGSKTILHALPILYLLGGDTDVLAVGKEADITDCEDCTIVKEYKDNWTGSLNDMIHSDTFTSNR